MTPHENSPLEESVQLDQIIYCGAHYKLCPVEVRELWSQGLNLDNGHEQLKRIIDETIGNSEFVVISTCNRFDLCLFGRLDPQKIPSVFAQFAQWTLQQRPQMQTNIASQRSWTQNLPNWLRIQSDDSALLHLFRVAASLDSLVLGEPHILGQLKDSYQKAISMGFCQQEATIAFNKAIQIAKRVRTETDLGKNAISIGHAAVEIIQRVFENLKKQRCLVIGAGEMGRISAQHLHACGAENITLANRTKARADELCTQLGFCTAQSLDEALSQLNQYDVIITATSCQDFLLQSEHGFLLQKRKSGLPAVVVDISVPRNVDPDIGKIPNIFVFDVDDLDKVMESSRQSRRSAAEAAEVIIASEMAEYISSKKQRRNLVHVGKFHQLITGVVQKEIQKSIRNKGQFDENQIKITADAVAKKLVAHAAQLARSEVQIENGSGSIGDVLQLLFKLPEDEDSAL
jgi:glutamyl-tRNA reductase